MSKGTLIAFGCSNTAGTESINDFGEGEQNIANNYNSAYPKFLADKLGYDYINNAYSGASNQEISSCVFNFINDTEFKKIYNPFILIGWTDDGRINTLIRNTSYDSEKMFFNFKNIIDFLPTAKNPCRTLSSASVNASLKILLNKQLTEMEQLHLSNMAPLTPQFVIDLNQHILNSPGFKETNFFAKYATASLLEQKQIPYLTLPTLWFDYNPKYFLLNQTCNILPFDRHGKVTFLPLVKFKEFGLSKIKAHMKEAGHKELAKYLYNYLTDNKLL